MNNKKLFYVVALATLASGACINGMEKVDTKQFNPFLNAAREGRLADVKQSVTDGTDVDLTDKDKWTALMHAAKEGHLNVVTFLVTSGATIDAQNDIKETALLKAAFKGHAHVVNYLLKQGATVDLQDKHGLTALIAAVKRAVKLAEKNKKIAQYKQVFVALLKAGANYDTLTSKAKEARKYLNGLCQRCFCSIRFIESSNNRS